MMCKDLLSELRKEPRSIQIEAQPAMSNYGALSGDCILSREFPGELEKIRVWFRDYKKPDGKPENKFGFDDQYQNKEYTLQVIQQTHELYNKLKSGKRENTEGLSLS